MIIGVLNQKGGVGKTTLSVNIASQLAADGSRVMLIDADPQGSALDWSAARAEPGPVVVIGLPKETIHREITQLARDYDHVVIDGPPRVTALARSAIMASDLVLIPVQPSPYDIWAADEVVKLINEALIYKPNLKATFAINRKISNTAIGRDVRDALAAYELPCLDASLTQRVVFAEAAAGGLAVHEVDPTSQAAQEVAKLVEELKGVMA